MDIYEKFQEFENERFLLRAVQKEDGADLLEVYSDKCALPFFNSDNCNGDNFYYATLQRMNEAIDFWKLSYENRWFVRWTIVDKTLQKAVGTIELCLRASEDIFNSMAVLRLDVRSDYEKQEVLSDIAALMIPSVFDMVHCGGVITKAPIYAVERICAVQKLGFVKSQDCLIGHDGYAYNGYWILRQEN